MLPVNILDLKEDFLNNPERAELISRPRDEKQLDMLRDIQRNHHTKMRAQGRVLTNYVCCHCNAIEPTLQPTQEEVTAKGFWDSSRTCCTCGKPNFVLTYPDGHTQSTKI